MKTAINLILAQLAICIAFVGLNSCTTYKAATVIVKPQAPVLSGNAAAQAYTEATAAASEEVPIVGTVSTTADEDIHARQVLYVGHGVERNTDVHADIQDSDTVSPSTDVSGNSVGGE